MGIDPGLRCTGYALLRAPPPCEVELVEAGVIRLTPGAALPARLIELADHLNGLVAQHAPTVLACEELYAHYKHPRTAILMGHARGVILLAAARAGLEVIPIAATNVKKLLTGSGHASKPQMQRAVAATLRLPMLPQPPDVADAIAIGLAGLRAHQAQGTLARRNARGRQA